LDHGGPLTIDIDQGKPIIEKYSYKLTQKLTTKTQTLNTVPKPKPCYKPKNTVTYRHKN